MNVITTSSITLKIEDEVLDSTNYQDQVDFYKLRRFYKTADFVIPYFRDGVTVIAEGEAGVDYKVDIGDLSFDFTESMSMFLPASTMESRVIDVAIYKEGTYLSGTSIAFVHYILFAYVTYKILLELLEDAREVKESRYLLDNEDFPEGFETVWGRLYGIGRFDTWSFEEYKDIITQIVSIFKMPVEKSLREAITGLGYKLFAEDVSKVWRWSPGFNRISNDNWEIEKI
jgi:hypothetical protein